MKNLSIILLNSNLNIKDCENIEILHSDSNNLLKTINDSNGKYICFICNNDYVTDNYISVVQKKCMENFNACFINYHINYNYKGKIKNNNYGYYLLELKPYYHEYIWNYIFKKEYLLQILNCNMDNFNNFVFETTNTDFSYIEDVIYYHNPFRQESTLYNFPFVDYRKIEFCKNIVYMGDVSGGFYGGFISWYFNIAREYGDKYEIMFIYEGVNDVVVENLNKYCKCIFNNHEVNYLCDSLITHYGAYNYPKNIYPLEINSVFIHRICIPNNVMFENDIYSNYYGVSKVCAESAIGTINTKNKIDYIYNPLNITEEMKKPILKLISMQRTEDIKRTDRLEIMAQILDDEQIPYTWSVFSDVYDLPNYHGLIYRKAVFNVIPYLIDSDYLVLLSDTEACSYSVLEALDTNIKVVVTPLDSFFEMGVQDGENGFVIPFDYFEPQNKEKLRKKIWDIYINKEKKFIYDRRKLLNSDKYNDILR